MAPTPHAFLTVVDYTYRGERMTEIAPRITVDESVRFGKPVTAGTRVPVDLVVGKMTIEPVMAEYELAREDVSAVLAYAARPSGNR